MSAQIASLRFEALGERVLVPFQAVRVPARVLWCNFDLARELGFPVPRDHRLDATLERKLVEAFSFRVLDEPDARAGAVTLYADRYYGSGMEDHRGSARGGVDLATNVFLKGIGRTPLARTTANAWHSNGVCHITQCVAEALSGEIAAQLFSAGAARVVAILDQHQTIFFEGQLRHCAIIVRASVPFRPAHLVRRLGQDLSDLPELFVRLVQLGGHLVMRGRRPDYAATMRRLLALQARTAAEQVRWRVLHGAISTSNIGLFGEMIDLNSQCTQARTAPISVQRVRRTRDGSFGGEHIARSRELDLLYLSVIESLSPHERAEMNAVPIDCASELEALYLAALETELLGAAGLPRALAEAIQRETPALTRRYREVLLRLMELRNPGSLNARISTCERIGVVDVFRVLARLARDRRNVRAHADLRVYGDPARRRRTRALATKGLDELAKLHQEVFESARRIVGARRFRSLELEIRERAELENRPIEDTFRARFLAEASVLDAVDAGSSEKLPDAVRAFLDARIARSIRSVERLLESPIVRRRGRLETQRRVHDGIEHVLCSKEGRAWEIEVRFARPPRFFEYSFDRGATVSVARPTRRRVRIAVRSRCGVLEGSVGGESVLPFAFAVPNAQKERW